MPRDESSRRVSTVSSTSWKHHGVDISGSRIVRARRALSAPLQGVLDDVFAKDKLGQTNVAANHTQKLIQDNTAFISQRNSEPESFPPYHDVYAQVSNAVSSLTSSKTATSLSPRNQPKVQYEDQNEKPRRPSQHRLHDELPGSATPSQGDSLSPAMKRRLTETMACLVRLHSHIGSHHTGSSSPSAVSIAYHRIGSSLDAAMDGPSPSTTYSPAHENDTAPDLIATPVQIEDRGVNDITAVPIVTPRPLVDVDISPWVQNLHENETAQNLSNTRPRRRSRLARFFQKIVRRASSRPKSLDLKRLWRRVRVWRSKSSCRHTPPIREEGVRPTKLARKVKPAKPSRHTQAAKTTSTGQARKQATQAKPPRAVQGHDHRTAKGVTHDILSSRAEAKAKRAFEAAPLLGAANTVFMAGS
ncbi:hypothetical protein BR93DRAFT_925998 [Coniochaeta sp. PMI_546]|nr:hypothetical protein BR93DRAFT_925998 [Coniochaeta sp. PMI_546]